MVLVDVVRCRSRDGFDAEGVGTSTEKAAVGSLNRSIILATLKIIGSDWSGFLQSAQLVRIGALNAS